MTLPVALIPVALSATRSLVLLNRKIGKIAVLSRLDEALPIFLPPVPENIVRDQQNDRTRMESKFSTDTPHRKALLARGLGPLFERYMFEDENALPTERRRELFFQFLKVFYEIEDAQEVTADQAGAADAAGLDQYLVKSDQLGRGTAGVQILRATAETLVDFLGENATVFLARSRHRVVVSTLLREFAAETDLETDTPERILKILLGSVAVAASDGATSLSEKPLAVLLFASLGKVRRDMGDEFVSQIISRDGFNAVVSDWLGRVATDDHLVELVAGIRDLDGTGYDPNDPATLPPELQPVYGVLAETLKTIGANLDPDQPLRDDGVFTGVFQAVLTGLSAHSTAFLAQELEGQRLMAQVLNATITRLSQAPGLRADPLVAPVFEAMLGALAGALPRLGNAEALSKAETLIGDLADRIASDAFQQALDRLGADRGNAFADAFLAELVGVIGARSDLLLGDLDDQVQITLEAVITAAPGLLERGVHRTAIAALLGDILGGLYPADTAKGAFAADILPVVTALIDRVDGADHPLDPEGFERVLKAYVTHFTENRPVWQELFDRGLIAAMVGAIGDGVAGAQRPPGLPSRVQADLLAVLLGAVGRRAGVLEDIAEGAADPPAVVAAALRALTTRAVDRAIDRLGRGAETAHLPQLAGRVLDLLLASAAHAPPSEADILAFLDAQILILTRGESA